MRQQIWIEYLDCRVSHPYWEDKRGSEVRLRNGSWMWLRVGDARMNRVGMKASEVGTDYGTATKTKKDWKR